MWTLDLEAAGFQYSISDVHFSISGIIGFQRKEINSKSTNELSRAGNIKCSQARDSFWCDLISS